MTDSIVVDTCVLINATNNDRSDSEFISCLSIVSSILDNDDVRLAVDNQWEIMEEYEAQLEGRTDPVAKALKNYIVDQTRKDSSKFLQFVFPISETKVEDLKKQGFHSSDIKFVKVGPESDLQTIISTDNQSLLENKHRK